MKKDSLNSSPPISLSVQSSQQIEEMFNFLSYFKVSLCTVVPGIAFTLILYVSKLHGLDYFKDYYYLRYFFRYPVKI